MSVFIPMETESNENEQLFAMINKESQPNSDRTYTCEKCSKNFKSKRSLVDHQKIHTGEKPYFCTYEGCEKRFTQFSSLQKHERVHNGEKPYRCHYPECPQTFSQISNMRRHYRTHTQEKPFACDLCGKRFNTSSNLKQHNEIHKTEQVREKFNCFICSRVYLHISSLKKHLKKHNKNYIKDKSDMYSSDFSQDLSNSTVFEDSFEFSSNNGSGVKSEVNYKSEHDINSPRMYTPKLFTSNSKRNEEVIFFSLEEENNFAAEEKLKEEFVESEKKEQPMEFEVIGNEVNYSLDNHKDFLMAEIKEEPKEESVNFASRNASCTCEFSSSMFHEHLCPFREQAPGEGEVVRSNAFVMPDNINLTGPFANFKI